MHLPGIYQPSKDIFSIGNYYKQKRHFALQTALLTNDKYEVVKRKPVVGYDSRRAWACNFVKIETLEHVLSCEFCEIFMNTFFTEHLRTTVPMIHLV